MNCANRWDATHLRYQAGTNGGAEQVTVNQIALELSSNRRGAEQSAQVERTLLTYDPRLDPFSLKLVE